MAVGRGCPLQSSFRSVYCYHPLWWGQKFPAMGQRVNSKLVFSATYVYCWKESLQFEMGGIQNIHNWRQQGFKIYTIWDSRDSKYTRLETAGIQNIHALRQQGFKAYPCLKLLSSCNKILISVTILVLFQVLALSTWERKKYLMDNR